MDHVFKLNDPDLALKLLSINVPKRFVEGIIESKPLSTVQIYALPDIFGESQSITIEVD